MKQLCSFSLAIVLLFSMVIPGFAVDASQSVQTVEFIQEIDLGNDLTVTRKVAVGDLARTTHTRIATCKEEYKYKGETIAVITIAGKFQYDGTTVSVLSKAVTETTTYDGWSFTQSSFTSSGGTITLKGKLTKTLIPAIGVSISLTCDKNGNFS